MSKSVNNESPEGEEPRKGKGGPPKGSQNAIRHGMLAGKLPSWSGLRRKPTPSADALRQPWKHRGARKGYRSPTPRLSTRLPSGNATRCWLSIG